MTVADLDGNGKQELVVAVMTYQKNPLSGNIPVSTYIHIFEEKNGRYRYMWKSEPLFYLNKNNDATGERISDMAASPQTGDFSLYLTGDRGNYELEFIDGYYSMKHSQNGIESAGVDKDLQEYLDSPVDACSVFTGVKSDFFITGKRKNSAYQITLYRIRYTSSDPFSFYTRWNTVPLTFFKVVSGKKTDMYIEATTAGTVNIYSMKKI